MSDNKSSDEKCDLYLSNMDNYSKNYSHSHETVFNIFSLIVNNYLEHCVNTIYIKDEQYLLYIIENGLNVIYNIFSLIYMYSKNLELTKQYLERGYYIYCEFIGKIGDNNHKYLQLNSKDATLFVFKKTIYELNNTYIRNFVLSSDEQQHIDNIKYLCEIYIKCVKINIQLYLNIICHQEIIHIPNTSINSKTERTIKLPNLNNLDNVKTAIVNNNKNILNRCYKAHNTIELFANIQTIIDNNYEKQEHNEYIKTISNLIQYTHSTIDENIFINKLNNYFCDCINTASL